MIPRPAQTEAAITVHALGRWAPEQIGSQTVPSGFRPTPADTSRVEKSWAAALAEASRAGRHLFDGPLARLEGHRASTARLDLALSPTSYRWFWGTNCRDRSLPRERRADPLGVSAVVVTADHWLILGRRSQRVSLYAGRVHPFGGCVEPDRAGDVPGEIRRELSEETGLHAADLSRLDCLGLVEDSLLVQPELLFGAHVRLDRNAVEGRLDPDEHDRPWAVAAEASALAAAILADAQPTPIARIQLLAWGRVHFGSMWFEPLAARCGIRLDSATLS